MTEELKAQQEAFERYTRRACNEAGIGAEYELRKKPNGSYAEPRIYAAWCGWKARGDWQRAPLQEIREALEFYSCDLCRDCRYGPGVVEDRLSNAMGGKPWITCPKCDGESQTAVEALATLDKLIDEQKGSEG